LRSFKSIGEFFAGPVSMVTRILAMFGKAIAASAAQTGELRWLRLPRLSQPIHVTAFLIQEAHELIQIFGGRDLDHF
jgi:hypothetical protein